MNKAKRTNHLWKLLLLVAIVLGITLVAKFLFFPPQADATVSYPNPSVECQIESPQKFKIGIVAYRWVLTSETSTTATFKLQVDINPTNNETWVNVGVNRTVDKPDCTPPVDPCDPQVSKIAVDTVIDPCVTPTPPVEPCLTNCNPIIVDNPPKPFVCTDGKTNGVVSNLHVWRNGEEATVNFFITNGDRADILYSEVSKPHWQHAVADLTPNEDRYVSYTVHGLDPNLGYDFGVIQRSGCGGGDVTSVVVDDPTPTLFRLSYYEF